MTKSMMTVAALLLTTANANAMTCVGDRLTFVRTGDRATVVDHPFGNQMSTDMICNGDLCWTFNFTGTETISSIIQLDRVKNLATRVLVMDVKKKGRMWTVHVKCN